LDTTHKKFNDDDSSAGSDRDEILERAFGVTRDQDTDARFLEEHRKKKMEWRKERPK